MNSKKKHNVNYIKPEEPAFLRRFKEQAGYVEGPNVDTKKEALPELSAEDCEDRDDEKPVVVVLKEGDLTEQEADLYAQAVKAVEAVDKADLSQRVIFKRKKDKTDSNVTDTSNSKEVKKKKKEKPKKTVLSFNDEEEEE